MNDEIKNAASVEAVVPDVFIRWISSLGMTLTPFYGKAIIHGSDLFYYDFYLESAVSLVKTEVNIATKSLVSPHTIPGGMFGVGCRFFMEDWFALRIAIRDYIFAEDNHYLVKGVKDYDNPATTGIFDNMFIYFGFSFLL